MGTRRGRQSIGLRVLLVVLSIQGVTPDARDMSSRWLIQQLARAALPTTTTTADTGLALRATRDTDARRRPGTSEIPSPGEDRERTPDEVCTAPVPDRPRARQKSPAHPDLPIVLALAVCPRVEPAPAEVVPPPGSLAPRAGLIHAVCRLTC